MAEDNIKVINDLLDRIKVTDENRETIERIRMYLEQRKYQEALAELQVLQASDKDGQGNASVLRVLRERS